MLLKTGKRLGFMIVLGLIVAGLASCSALPGAKDDERPGGGKNSSKEDAKKKADEIQTGAAGDSLKLFKETIYPLGVERCAACHSDSAAPKFASDNPVTSHEELVKAKKVDLASPDKSRIYLRVVEDAHNCWSDCEADGKEMLDLIQKWADGMGESEEEGNEEKEFSFTTVELAVKDFKTKKIGFTEFPGRISFEAESSTPTGTLIIEDDEGQSGGKVISSTEGGTAVNTLVADAPDLSTLGSVSYDLDIQEKGTYLISVLVSSPGFQTNDFYVKINSDEPFTWDAPSNNNYGFSSVQSVEDGNTTVYLDWDVGTHRITFYQAIVGAKIDRLIVRKDVIEDLSTVEVNPFNSGYLSYSLDDALGVDATFMIAFSEYSKGEGSYIIANPSFLNPEQASVRIKGIYPLINGDYQDNNATYTEIDITTSDKGKLLSPSPMVMLQTEGIDSDVLSFGFDLIEIVADNGDEKIGQ